MSQQYVRLALCQMVLVFFVILFTGLSLKARFTPLSPTAFPVLVRNYGFLLLLAPAAWCFWAVWQSRRPTYDTRDEALIGATGIGLCIAIVALGWFSCSAAWAHRGVIMAAPERTPASFHPTVRFQAYDGAPPEFQKMTFQVKASGRSEFLKLGDTIPKTTIRLSDFDPATQELIVTETTTNQRARLPLPKAIDSPPTF
jgi:hypothetical protein